MKINPHDPAYPIRGQQTDEDQLTRATGLPIRLELAARFMAAAIASEREEWLGSDMEALAALGMADALIAAYNEGQE